MTVVVIGGGGYIGRPLVRLLSERVDTISADIFAGQSVTEAVDVSSPSQVYRLFLRTKPDVIVVTAYMLDRASNANPMRAAEINVLGMTNVFQAAADLNVRRVVFASSGAVYGYRDESSTERLDESVDGRPESLYGRMKQFNEWMAEHYNKNFGTEIVSYRISGPYGAGKSVDRFGGEIPFDTVVAAARTEQQVVLPWSAKTRFRFIHVEDAAASFLPLVLSETVDHHVYNAPGFTVSVGEVAEAAASVSNLTCEFTEPGRPVRFVSWDSTRYDEEFGFKPRPMADWMRDEVQGKPEG